MATTTKVGSRRANCSISMCYGEAATRSGTLISLTTGIGGMNDDPRNAVSIHLWASLVPAAAVIPAQVAYFDVVAVKKLVVGWHPRGPQ